MALFSKKAPTKKETEQKRVTAHAVKRTGGVAHELIRAPWFTEKAIIMTEQGVYTFAVPPHATKALIAGAIKELYNVAPRDVKIVNLPAKSKAFRNRRGVGVRARRRKAYVYLNKGDTIQFA
jgi:large subunit ribosomal protein L23